MDEFTKIRLTNLLSTFKSKHGRDISGKELEAEGFTGEQIKDLVKSGYIRKYQVNMTSGAIENRYCLQKGWKK